MLDFEFVLVLLTAVSGVIWGWDRWRRRRAHTTHAPVSWWVDLGRSLFPVIIIVLVIRSFVVEPFRIPSGSMLPTLEAGDFILVNKFGYGLRAPVGHQLIMPIGEPERGDVAVFRYPRDPGQDYIKRIIGLPGDEIVYLNKRLRINGEVLPVERLGPWSTDASFARLREQIDGDWHAVLTHAQSSNPGFSLTVPAGEFFVMGDNRDRSSDSRFWGTVPRDHLVGKAFFIWLSWNGGPNFERIGTIID